jgi:hypothetical protein
MERSLRSERLYSLKDYNNIKFTDEITGIPERVCLNPELMGELSYLQMIGFELAVRKYAELMKLSGSYELEVIMKYLEEERTQTLEKIKEIFTETEPSK